MHHSKNLVLLKSSNTNDNLFMLHDGTGNITAYYPLSRHLSKLFNCYGIRVSDYYTPQKNKDVEITKIAQEYLKQIEGKQPVGPYNFIGWSVGGVLAFELCRLIKRKTKQVVNLVLIDTPSPNVFTKKIPMYDTETFQKYANTDVDHKAFMEILNLFLQKVKDKRYRELISKLLMNFAEYLYSFTHAISIKNLDILLKNICSFANSLKKYRIKKIQADNTILIDADKSIFKNTIDWRRHIKGNLTQTTLDDDHFTIINNKQLPLIIDDFFKKAE